MKQKHLIRVLIVVLLAACVILTVNLVSLYRASAYLPAETVEDIVAILAESAITVDPAIIPTKREMGTVYVCNSSDYNHTVASLLGGSAVASAYIIPDGEILLLENGVRMEFGADFSFRFDRDGDKDDDRGRFDPSLSVGHVGEEKRAEITDIVVDFLDRGSREFAGDAGMNIRTVVDTIWEDGGKYRVLCSRTIDGVAVTENYALCTVWDGEVTEAYGSWSFLTLGERYTAQLADLFNILFNVKKEIGEAARQAGGVTIEAIHSCYSLYFYGEEEDFCLIPCWQIVTDTMGEWIYNAIDRTLYTNN